mgnify:CR=1 FL=1
MRMWQMVCFASKPFLFLCFYNIEVYLNASLIFSI